MANRFFGARWWQARWWRGWLRGDAFPGYPVVTYTLAGPPTANYQLEGASLLPRVIAGPPTANYQLEG